MLLLKALALGVVQGLTEFLPISSSGHLVAFSEVLGTGLGQNVAFDVALHAATLLAILVYFRRRVASILKGMVSRSSGFSKGEGRVGWLILLGTIPAAIFGLLFERPIERAFSSLGLTGVCFLVTAAVLILADRLGEKKKESNIGPFDALLIGMAQAIALLPGISRSGMTIVAGLWRGLSKEEAPQFAFLLSVPAILGATAFKAEEMFFGPIQWPELTVGFVASFLSGLLAIWVMLGVVRRNKLSYFSPYLTLIGAASVVASLAGWG